ncbi:MAG: phosphoribosylglycinamide formyltransferase [Planctomycetes bacterium]|nr:phosphoribosylglycinamide formyltransferase [Planctomycetota bacterium]
MNVAVLISGTGRTLQNFIDEIAAGRLDARIELVVASKPGLRGADVARRAGLPVEVIDRRAFNSDAAFGDAVTRAVDARSVDLVLLAGFLHLWMFPDRYRGRVLNIHPALLPAFGGKGMYGRRVHEAVLKSGARESGCTVHFADHRYDGGHVILQRKVPVLPGDTPDSLAERVFEQEKIAYPEAVRRVASGAARLPPP